MKKIFTLAAAVLASFSLWAAEPNYGSYDWGEGDFATVFANHDGIVLSSDASAWKGNFSGIQYVALGGGTDMSAASPTPYFGITADAPIDSIEVFWAPNGTNNTSIAWAGWEEASELLNQTVVAMGKTETYKASKSYDAAIWQKIDFSGYDFKAVMLARQIKKAIIDGQQQSNLGDNQTVNILGIRVWVRETKTIVSTVETLTGVSVNGTAISAEQFNSLTSAPYYKGGFPEEEFAAAPTFVFTKHIVITYDDSTTKESDVEVEVEGVADADEWVASLTINSIEYHVYAVKLESVTVTYMDGETVLGTEIVEEAGTAAEYAQYETKPLATFEGWYSDAALTQPINLAEHMFFVDETVYAKFTKAYLANSVNIEGWIVANGKNTNAFKSVLDAANIEYDKIDALDSLNNSKGAGRNEPYLGLKIKKNGGYIACNVQSGTTLRIKFGYVGDPVLAIAGGDTLRLVPTDNKLAELTVPFMIEKLVKLQTTSDKTVVIKQIMIDEPVANVMYPIAYNIGEGGTVTGWTIAFPGEEVVMNITSEEGNALYSLTYNEIPMVQTAPGAPIFFTMPAEPVTVAAEFGIATGINNAEEAVKTVKVLRNGQLFIEKNGVLFNAQGARL